MNKNTAIYPSFHGTSISYKIAFPCFFTASYFNLLPGKDVFQLKIITHPYLKRNWENYFLIKFRDKSRLPMDKVNQDGPPYGYICMNLTKMVYHNNDIIILR